MTDQFTAEFYIFQLARATQEHCLSDVVSVKHGSTCREKLCAMLAISRSYPLADQQTL